MSDIATWYRCLPPDICQEVSWSPAVGQSVSSKLTSTMGTHRYSIGNMTTSSFSSSLSSSTLSSSYSLSSSCSSSCSYRDNSEVFWQKYQRGRKIYSFWKSLKMVLISKNKVKRKETCCLTEGRGRSIQQFYEDLYFRENRNKSLSDSFQTSSNSDQTIYSIIDEDLYYVPYHW